MLLLIVILFAIVIRKRDWRREKPLQQMLLLRRPLQLMLLFGIVDETAATDVAIYCDIVCHYDT